MPLLLAGMLATVTMHGVLPSVSLNGPTRPQSRSVRTAPVVVSKGSVVVPLKEHFVASAEPQLVYRDEQERIIRIDTVCF